MQGIITFLEKINPISIDKMCIIHTKNLVIPIWFAEYTDVFTTCAAF